MSTLIIKCCWDKNAVVRRIPKINLAKPGSLASGSFIYIYLSIYLYIYIYIYVCIYIEYTCYNLKVDIFTLEGTSLKLVDKFTYLGSSVSSTEKDIDTRLKKAWTAIDRLSIIWKSDLTNKMKRSFFQEAVMSILLDGCTTWTLTKRQAKTWTAITQECCE